jgi:hypothetical protein
MHQKFTEQDSWAESIFKLTSLMLRSLDLGRNSKSEFTVCEIGKKWPFFGRKRRVFDQKTSKKCGLMLQISQQA